MRGLRLSGSADAIRSELGVGIPLASTTYGLGRTPASTVSVAGVSPDGVFGLHPVGLPVIPNEIDPPDTPT